MASSTATSNLPPASVPSVAPQSLTPQDYLQWAMQANQASQSPVAGANKAQPLQTINAQGQTVTTVPDATTAEAGQSSFNNIPVNQLITPEQAPSAWATPDPNARMFVGATDNVTMGHNAIIGSMADKFGIKHNNKTPEKSLEELVMEHVAKLVGVKTMVDVPAATKATARLPASDIYNGDDALPIIGKKTTPAYKEKIRVDPHNIATALGLSASGDPTVAIANRFGVNTSTNGTPQTIDVASAESGIRSSLNSRGKIEALQQRLENAGYYTSDQMPGAANSFTAGSFDLATQQAVGALLSETAANNKIVNGKVTGAATNWMQVLDSQTQAVDAQGGIQAVLKKAISKRLPQATESQLTSPATTAFQAELGQGPTEGEMQQFTAAYDAGQVNKYGQLAAGTPTYADQSGVMTVPGLATPVQGAAQFAEQNNPTAYFGHKILNAANMMAAALSSGTPLDAQGAPNAAGLAQ